MKGNGENNKKLSPGIIIFLAVFFVLVLVLTLAFWPLIKKLQDSQYRNSFSAWIQSLGWKGVVILFCIEIIQVVLPFIPGGPAQVIAGAAYGSWGGAAILMAGCLAATSFIYLFMGKYALPIAKRFFGDEALKKYQFLIAGKDPGQSQKHRRNIALVVFVLFLIPGLPKDLFTYLAPASGMAAPAFIALSLLGRFPALFSSTLAGDKLASGKWAVAFIVFAFVALLGILGICFADPILETLKSGFKKKSLKK